MAASTLKVTVKVEVDESSTILISVGDGRQTFRWLAQVIQSRIAEAKLDRKSFQEDYSIVTSLKNRQGELINPKDFIYEHCEQGSQELYVSPEIAKQFPSDEWGDPVYGDWQQAAYIHTGSGEKWAAEMENWREKMREIEEEKTRNKDEGHGILGMGSTLLQIGDLLSPTNVASAFALDWNNMKWAWFPAISEQKKIALHDSLKANYAVICNIFIHYCGVGHVGQRYGMTIREFEHFLLFSNLCLARDASFKAESVHQGVTRPPPVSSAPTSSGSEKTPADANNHSSYPLISRSVFAECLVYWVLEERIGARGGGNVWIGEGVKYLLTNLVSELWNEVKAKYVKYRFPDPATMNQYYLLLKSTYHNWASFDPLRGPALTFNQYTHLMSECAVVDPRKSNTCERCFNEALLSRGGGGGGGGFAAVEDGGGAGGVRELVFCEFLEAVALLAIETMQDEDDFTEQKMVRLVYNLVSEAHEPPPSTRK